jgi:ubiquinone/menaquinone biosynthesis C-methylase UbiE
MMFHQEINRFLHLSLRKAKCIGKRLVALLQPQIHQSSVSKIVQLAQPEELLEMGFGTGDTTFRLANENPGTSITSLDLRESMVHLAEQRLNEEGMTNVRFIQGEMTDYVQEADSLPDFLLFLYSFHHIEDPLEKKVDFLSSCFDKLPSGGYLCIAETFLPESCGQTEFESRNSTIVVKTDC